MQYCGPCAPNEAIVAYTEGRLHEKPSFGDSAQMRVAKHGRRLLFRQLLLTCNPAMYDWPEYKERFGYRDHLQRITFLGRTKVLLRDKRPESLRRTMEKTYQQLLATLGPRRFNTGPARRAFKNAYNTWVRENLAEAELLIFGRIVYGEPAKMRSSIADKLEVAHMLTERAAEHELEVA